MVQIKFASLSQRALIDLPDQLFLDVTPVVEFHVPMNKHAHDDHCSTTSQGLILGGTAYNVYQVMRQKIAKRGRQKAWGERTFRMVQLCGVRRGDACGARIAFLA